ncbi:Uncharacterised protein [Mycobacteroides abscessus subsp. abscessus]|nr:Uncharacterised protein [Mycobacteroides abscessus subsp. abscessus]
MTRGCTLKSSGTDRKASPMRCSSALSTAVTSFCGSCWSSSTDSLGRCWYFSKSRTSLKTRSSWPW